MKKITTLLTITALGLLTPAYADHHGAKKEKTVVEIATGNESFSTLVAAVKAAGLAEALSADGPFTIFAPNNEAFKKLPTGTVETLLKPENKEKLASADVKAGEVATLNGKKITIKITDGKVMIDGATVTKTDLAGANGVIHVIDSVVIPK